LFLVAGLGNPGPKYRSNRHNVGFMVVDLLRERWGAASWRDKFRGELVKADALGQEIGLLKPMTYMNLSGESVQKAMAFFKLSLKDIVVVHDELDLVFGTSRVKLGGGAAGHNGIRSITQQCGADFARVRIGIGRPTSGSAEGYVLSDFTAAERAELGAVLGRAADAVEAIVTKGAQAAMNEFNARDKNASVG